MIAGKKDLLKTQFLAADLWLIGMQETRLPTSAVLPDRDFLMLNVAADDQGHHGCALWINLHHAFAHDGEQAHKIHRDQVVMTHFSPRHLQVHITTPRLALTVLVLHAPKIQAQGEEAVAAFWRARADDLCQRPPHSECIVLADANSHIGSIVSDSVGSAGAEDENREGFYFQQFLRQIACFVPSTFPDVHHGPHWTWMAPGDNACTHRLDFVAVPLEWKPFDQRTQVWYDLEALQMRKDHMALRYHCAFCKLQPGTKHVAFRGRAVRPPRCPTTEERATFAAQLAALPAAPWHLDVDLHYLQQAQSLAQIGTGFCPVTPSHATQTYLTEATLQLVGQRKAYRKYLRLEEAERSRRLLMVAFAAFLLNARGQTFTEAMQTCAEAWLTQIDQSLAHALERLYELTTAVRAAVKRDRVSYLDALAGGIALHDLKDPKSLYAAVRKAFPKASSSRRMRFQPLPAVRLENGMLAPDAASRRQRWTEFFQAQEAGEQVAPEAYKQLFHRPDFPVLPDGPVFEIHALPTLLDFEQQLHAAKYGKASGPDALTAELLRLSVPASSAILYPVSLKASLQVREPCEWRGGSLISLAKRATAAYECRAFRSILLASVVAKTHHRLLRDRLSSAYRESKTELQSGQLPGVGVDSLSLLARTYQLRVRHLGYRCALTYFDVKAAFYKVIRQSLVRTDADASDAGFLAVLYDLGVPESALPELIAHLRSMETIAAAGASPHLQSQVSDLFRGSWFRMDHTGPLVATRRGTRPGDPLADLLFAFAFSAYLRSAEEALRRNNLHTFVPPAKYPLPDLLPDIAGPEPPEMGCLAWADDYSHLQMHKCPTALCERVRAATGVLLTHATANGMELTFERDKTAVLLSSDCPRAVGTAAGLQPAADDMLVLEVKDDIKCETRHLPVVASYKHLGSITVANATPTAEIQFRFVQAVSVLRHLQKKLFASRDILLRTRRTLLRSLVVSRFVFSSASLVLQAHTHRRRWSQCFLKLWRGLLPPVAPEHQQHSYAVLALAEAPSPLLAMAQARAVFYHRIHREGPQALVLLLHAHWGEAPKASWLGQFLWDIRAVAPYSEAAQAFLATDDPVKALLQAFSEDPHWWTKQVGKAIRAYQADLRTWQGHGVTTQPRQKVPDSGQYRCPHCASSFRLRKHLCTHLARAHQQYSIARHFVPAPFCLACHRYFHTVTRTQHHVKRTPACLRRLAHVLKPMTLTDILEAEAVDRLRAKDIRKGKWRVFEPAQPVVTAYGPRAPTYTEALGDGTDASITLDRLQRQYRPSAAVLAWVNAYISGASVEGPRQEATDFWLKRPGQM